MEAPAFQIQVEIDVPVAEVHAFLLHLDNYVELHPLIESIEELPPLEAMPEARHYRVIDRIPIGPLRMKTAYRAALQPISDHEVHGHAWQSPGVRLHTVYALTELTDRSGATRIDERVHIEAPRLLRRFVISQGRAAHEETLRKMKVLLERRRGAAPSAGC